MDVAITITAPAVVGAVYVVAAPLAVCVGLKLPQVAAGVQLQSTPALVLSFETVAVRLAVAPAVSDCGAPVMVPLIGGGVVTVLFEPPPQPISSPADSKKAAHTLILVRMKTIPCCGVRLRLGKICEGRATLSRAGIFNAHDPNESRAVRKYGRGCKGPARFM